MSRPQLDPSQVSTLIEQAKSGAERWPYLRVAVVMPTRNQTSCPVPSDDLLRMLGRDRASHCQRTPLDRSFTKVLGRPAEIVLFDWRGAVDGNAFRDWKNANANPSSMQQALREHNVGPFPEDIPDNVADCGEGRRALFDLAAEAEALLAAPLGEDLARDIERDSDEVQWWKRLFEAAHQAGRLRRRKVGDWEILEFSANVWDVTKTALEPLMSAESDTPHVKVPKERATGRKPPVNARLLDLLQRRPESLGWSATKIATALGCSPSSIKESKAWKALQVRRTHDQFEAAERQSKKRSRRH